MTRAFTESLIPLDRPRKRGHTGHMMRKLALSAASVLLAVGSFATPAVADDGDYPGSPGHGPGSERDWICKTQAPWRCWCYDHEWCRAIVWGPYAYLFEPY